MPTTLSSPTVRPTEQVPHRGLAVLIVADRSADAEVLAVTLEAVGCDVASAPLGLAAAELAQVAQPDVVVVVADRADGAGIPKAVADRAGWRKPFVVVLTAPGAAGNPGDGVHMAVERPVSPELLIGLIRRFRALLAGIDGFDPSI